MLKTPAESNKWTAKHPLHAQSLYIFLVEVVIKFIPSKEIQMQSNYVNNPTTEINDTLLLYPTVNRLATNLL